VRESDGEVLVLTTVADSEQARALAQSLLDLHLAACVTCIAGGLSFFRWKSATVSQEQELVLLLKTHRAKLAEIERHFQTAHPYEVPELVVLPIAALSDAYGEWMRDELNLSPKGDA